ncbi:MAG TPA: hypothetical protein VKQ36_09940 [Ktedonobacterales bacterium]|nr:hypothetical protein [Ktedonobacterales bacterium]
MMRQPLLLDLFAGSGGAGQGYTLSGFRVVGVDLDAERLKVNPHEHYQGDAIETLDSLLGGDEWNGYRLADFAAFHASPPCQDYSVSRHVPRKLGNKKDYPRLIIPVRERLQATGLPWVIENVVGSERDMNAPIMLCGSMFGLHLRRHRWFDSNCLLFAAGSCCHSDEDIGVYGHGAYRMSSAYRTGSTYLSKGKIHYRPQNCCIAEARKAMGISWMNFRDLAQAIPPAYTHWLGAQLLRVVMREGVA